MAFTYTKETPTVFGNKRRVNGTYTNTSSSTGGDIVTGLTSIEVFNFTASTPSSPKCVSSFDGGTVTITTAADQVGKWTAEGI